MERDLGLKRTVTRGRLVRGAASGLAILAAVACGSESSYRPPIPAAATPKINVVDTLAALSLPELVDREKRLEAVNSGKSLKQIDQADIDSYMYGYARIYAAVETQSRVDPVRLMTSTTLLNEDQYQGLTSRATAQNVIRGILPGAMVVIQTPQGPRMYINKDSDIFTPNANPLIGPNQNSLKVLGGILSVGYSNMAPDFLRPQ